MIAEIRHGIAYGELYDVPSFFATEGGTEIGLVLECAGRVEALIEIKSGSRVDIKDLKHLKQLGHDVKGAEQYCLHGEDTRYREGDILAVPWLAGVQGIVRQLRGEGWRAPLLTSATR